MKNDILILVPEKTAMGGTTTYYNNIEHLFSFNVKYLTRGKKNYPFSENKIKELFRLFSDFMKYVFIIRKYKLVHINTSIRLKSLFRDASYILFARLFNKKIVLTFHAWDKDLEKKIKGFYAKLFMLFFLKVDSIITLSRYSQEKLIEWGYRKPVYTETTIVDKKLRSNFNESAIEKKYESENGVFNLLFLARIEKAKGIYEALDTFKLLKKKYPKMVFNVVGDGLELDNMKKYALKKELVGVNFLGHKSGPEVAGYYAEADLYFFPSYTEGMPTTVLEAMAFGLPVVTRSVGGLVDFFLNGKMGFMTESYDPQYFADLIDQLLENREFRKEIAFYNYDYANKHFMSDVVVRRLEKIYQEVLSS